MQADVPGGHAAGADVALDPDDILMRDFLRDELESNDGSDHDNQDVALEEGYEVLCEAWKSK